MERNSESTIKQDKSKAHQPGSRKLGLTSTLPVFPWLQHSLGRSPLFLSDRNVFKHMLAVKQT